LKICLVQPLFAPNREMLERNLRSIKSIKNLIGLDIDYYFSGWVGNDDFWKEYDIEISKLNPKKYLKQDENFGKAYNVNLLTKDLIDYDLLLTMDSDIIFLDGYDYLSKIQEISDIENLGVISFNQLEGNCHLVSTLNQEKIHNNHRLIWNNSGGGVAGGCVLIDFKFWKTIGGYRLMGVYAGDDAFLFMDAKRLQKFYGLDQNIDVIHPIETNRSYQDWKIKVCQRDSNGRNRDSISGQINESMEFWNNL
jgi:hypothetical protein